MNVERVSSLFPHVEYAAIYNAMRQCRGLPPLSDIKVTPEIIKKCNHYIFHRRHYALLELTTLTFRVSECSRSFIDQLRTHRHLSFFVRSMKVDGKAEDPKPIFPFDKYHSDIEYKVRENYERQKRFMGILMGNGVSRDDARLVMPLMTESGCVVSGNARAWFEFIPKRLCKYASKEIQTFAMRVRDELATVFNVPEVTNIGCLQCASCGSTEADCVECE